MKTIIWNTSANHVLFLQKSLVKIMLLIMKLNQFQHLENQFMLDLLYENEVNGWCMTSITTLLKEILMLNCYLLHRQSYSLNEIRRCWWRIFKRKHLFDFSNYPKDSIFFYSVNEKLFGKIKDVSEGKINVGLLD